METASERRKRKLAALVKQYGLAGVAEKSGLNAAALDQVLKGVKPKLMKQPKALGNRAARAIEVAYKLGEGWFDTDAKGDERMAFGDLNAFEAQLVTFFRQLPPEKQHDVLTALNSMIPAGKPSRAHPFGSAHRVRGTSVLGELTESESHPATHDKRLPPKAR